MIAAYGLFSIQDALVKWLVADYSVFQILFVRSAAVFLVVVVMGGWRSVAALRFSVNKKSLALRAGLLLGGWLLFYSAASKLGLAELTTIYYVAPVITVVLSVLILKETVGLGSWIAVFMGLAGVAIAAKPGGDMALLPALLTLGAAVCWAFSGVLGRLISHSESTTSQMIVANAAFALCCGFAMLWVWRTPSVADLGLMTAIAVAGGLAQLAMYEGYRYAPASLTAPTEYTSFVWSFLFAYAIWSEVPSPQVWAGAVLIAGSGLALLWIKRPAMTEDNMQQKRAAVSGGRRMPRSLYSFTARSPAETPALDGEKRVDVAIVGGGFTGLSAALHLAQSGVRVAVLEAYEPGWGASGRNGGQVNAGLKHEPDQVERDFGPELGRRMIELSGNAPDKVFDLIKRHQIECEAVRNGTIRTAFTPASARFLARATASLQKRGSPVEALDRKRMAETTGTGRYLFGALDRRGGSLNPLSYVRGLAEAAMRNGASIHGSTRVEAVSRLRSSWRLTTKGGNVEADWVVLATNAYTDALWPALARTVVPAYSGIVATEALPSGIAERILPGRQVLYEHEALMFYYRVDAANRFLIGGRSASRPLEGAAMFPDIIRYALQLFPFLKEVQWSHGWNGQVAITPDHYPHLHEPASNVIACIGYNGRGVALATAMGAEIARRVTGTPASELSLPVTDIRPIRFHSLWPIAVRARLTYARLIAALCG